MKDKDKIKILFLASDPSDAVRLRLGQELRDIREKLQLSKKRDSFLLESRESVRPGDITQAIYDISPQVIHFSGHGSNKGELCFEDNLGQVKSVPPDALSNLFSLFADQVKCVVLNACYSENNAKAIAKYIPYVIGMNQVIGDRAAIIFAVGFYKAIGAGYSFEEAYKLACVEAQLEGISEQLTPVLYQREKSISVELPVYTKFINDQELIYIDSVDTIDKHGSMWRWDTRMFRHRYPQVYTEFDLVGLELGRSWWLKYPEQDWVLRDWNHEQIGQYCLCPIKDNSFLSLMEAKRKETDLSPDDIPHYREILGHKYWYLSNFMRARVRPGVPQAVAEFASNIMVYHVLNRALESEHFATKFNKEISVITFVEAKSIEKTAKNNRFFKVYPHSNDDNLRKIHYAVWERKHIEVKLNSIQEILNNHIFLIKKYKDQSKTLFQQPPNY